MKLVIVVLNIPHRTEDCLAALVDLDVAGLQVMDTSSVMCFLAQEAPIFAGLRQLLTRPQSHSKTIFGLTEDAEIIAKLARTLREIDLDLEKSGAGYAFLLPLADWTGGIDEE